jgi:hypothetical protein
MPRKIDTAARFRRSIARIPARIRHSDNLWLAYISEARRCNAEGSPGKARDMLAGAAQCRASFTHTPRSGA